MPGTRFKKADLAAQVAGNYDLHIEAVRAELATLQLTDHGERHYDWRMAAERQVVDLYERLEEASDAELSRFSISSPPYPGELDWKITSLKDRLASAEKNKHKALAYVAALAADQDDVVEVYAADLKRIGYSA